MASLVPILEPTLKITILAQQILAIDTVKSPNCLSAIRLVSTDIY